MGRRLFAIAFSAAVVACSAFGAEPSGGSSSSGAPPAPPPPVGSSSGAPGDSGLPGDDGGGGDGGGVTDAGGGGGCLAPTAFCVAGYSSCCGGGICTGKSGSAKCCLGDGAPCTTAAECCPSTKGSLSAMCSSGTCVQF